MFTFLRLPMPNRTSIQLFSLLNRRLRIRSFGRCLKECPRIALQFLDDVAWLYCGFLKVYNKYILEEWQTSWNNSIGNKLLDIKPTIGEYQSVVRNIRREEVVLARLRLGHTRVTHSYLLQGEEHPQCVGCDAPFTVRHFLLECGDFAQVRNNCFHVDNMKELFQDIHIDSIMTFLRQINLFNKI